MITIQVLERTQSHDETNEVSSYQVIEINADGVKSYEPITAKIHFGYHVESNPA